MPLNRKRGDIVQAVLHTIKDHGLPNDTYKQYLPFTTLESLGYKEDAEREMFVNDVETKLDIKIHTPASVLTLGELVSALYAYCNPGVNVEGNEMNTYREEDSYPVPFDPAFGK